MTTDEATPAGRYLYAIADHPDHKDHAGQATDYGNIGINGARVYSISQSTFMAIVSDISEDKLRPERKNLVAHNNVIKRLMEESTILPVAFGTISQNNKALLKILKDNHTTFSDQLGVVRGKVEMGIRVVLDVPNIFGYLVAQHQELADLRDELLNKQHGPSQSDKIEMGRLFDRLLNEDRELHVQSVLDVLSARCTDIKQNPTREEKTVMHLACLVDRGSLKDFEDGVFEAANKFDNNFSFDFNGPWAPHHFVSLALAA